MKEKIKQALLDLLDGQYAWYEIQEQTGLPADRCKEIEALHGEILAEKTRIPCGDLDTRLLNLLQNKEEEVEHKTLQSRMKVSAVKLHRMETGASLKKSLEYIKELMKANGL